MRRTGGLFEQIIAFPNLLAAAGRAARGKRERPAVARFEFHLERELIALQEELVSDRYRPGAFFTFEVRDPKRRAICAAPFRDRVVHHAVCAVLEPVFERRAIFDSYACRRGKGTHAAVARAQHFARAYPFFAKCDVRRFFASIDHQVLRVRLRCLFREPALIGLLDRIIARAPPGAEPGRGLPIGNLTSQHFANLYLGELDHELKERRRVKGYVRYMDDLLLFAKDKETLHLHLGAVRGFLRERLGLVLKEEVTRVAPVTEGIPYLGLQVFPGLVRLDRRSRRRFLRQVAWLQRAHGCGVLGTEALGRRAGSLFAHAAHADSLHLRRVVAGASIAVG